MHLWSSGRDRTRSDGPTVEELASELRGSVDGLVQSDADWQIIAERVKTRIDEARAVEQRSAQQALREFAFFGEQLRSTRQFREGRQERAEEWSRGQSPERHQALAQARVDASAHEGLNTAHGEDVRRAERRLVGEYVAAGEPWPLPSSEQIPQEVELAASLARLQEVRAQALEKGQVDVAAPAHRDAGETGRGDGWDRA